MIVYAGKQYWNDYNNWDEALFQDANRPRDNDKFKLRPWLQSDKWDWRWANKWISYWQFQAKSLSLVWGTTNGASLNIDVPTLKEKYTASDFSSLNGYTQYGWKSYTSAELAGLAEERAWGKDSEAMFRDWMVYIAKSWSYMIEASAQYYRPSGYDSSNSYLTKLWVFLFYGTKKDDIKEWSHRQSRACGFPDYIDYWTVADIPAWTYLTIWGAHTYKNGSTPTNTMVGYALNLYRLS